MHLIHCGTQNQVCLSQTNGRCLHAHADACRCRASSSWRLLLANVQSKENKNGLRHCSIHSPHYNMLDQAFALDRCTVFWADSERGFSRTWQVGSVFTSLMRGVQTHIKVVCLLGVKLWMRRCRPYYNRHLVCAPCCLHLPWHKLKKKKKKKRS